MTKPEPQPPPSESAQQLILNLVLRVGLFALIVILAAQLLPLVIFPIVDYFAGAALTVFGAGAIANALAYRVWERANLADAGLDWSPAARSNLLYGLAIGLGSGVLITVLLLITGGARLTHPGPVSWSSLIFVTIVLMFGAVGEELMFRGYGFQTLSVKIGQYATLLPMAVIFGLAHAGNVAATPLSVINTTGWGLLLGYATLRSRGLWLPVGIHYGWNWILPALGAELSGFKMGVTGLALETAPNFWGGGAYGPEASLSVTLLLPGLFYLIRRLPIERQQTLLLRGLEDED